MTDVTVDATDVIDIWPYVQSVPSTELAGHSVYDQFVDKVYRDSLDRFDHVLVLTRTKNVYLVVVVDLKRSVVYGHHLLNLNDEYGLPTPEPSS